MAIADKAFVRAREVGCGKAEQNNRRTGYEWELQKHSVGFSVHCLSPPCGCGEWKELFRYLSNIRMSCIELFASWKQVSQTCLLISFSFSCHILWKTSFFCARIQFARAITMLFAVCTVHSWCGCFNFTAKDPCFSTFAVVGLVNRRWQRDKASCLNVICTIMRARHPVRPLSR